MDDLGRTSHPGAPRDLVKWRLEGSSSSVLGCETHAQHPSGHGARRSTGATGGIAHGSEAITPLHQLRGDEVHPERPVVASERGGPLTASSVTKWFFHLYRDVGMTGCSSHSGRRTFITRAARKVGEVGGSVRDVQQLAGHASLQTTQRYIEGDTEAKRKLVQLI